MTPDWQPLRQELAAWRAEGREIPVWWRDDDAIAPTEALDQLLQLSRDVGLPVHIAVVPQPAQPELAKVFEVNANAIAVAHGLAHKNHAAPQVKKSEFGAARGDGALADIQASFARMNEVFATNWAPMFVPPWNRIDPSLSVALADAGFNALSTYLPRREPDAAPGVAQINTHIDPIDWRGTRGLVDPEKLIAQAVSLLADRRAGLWDASEPFGYLTHHLVHDAALWEFSRQYLSELMSGPVRVYRHLRLNDD